AFPNVTALSGFVVDTRTPRSARIFAAMPSVRFAFASPIATPRVFSDWTASLRSFTGWPIALVTFTANSPTVMVDFWDLFDAANATTVRATLTATTTMDFLIIRIDLPLRWLWSRYVLSIARWLVACRYKIEVPPKCTPQLEDV